MEEHILMRMLHTDKNSLSILQSNLRASIDDIGNFEDPNLIRR